MRKPHDWIVVLTFALLGAACSRPADSAEHAAPDAARHEAAAPAADVDATPADENDAVDDEAGTGPVDSPADLAKAMRSGAISMAAAFAAGAEQCGMATRAQNQAAYPAMRAKLVAQGATPAEIDRQFWTTYDAALARARMTDPAKVQADCAQLRAMADPKQAAKFEQAAREMEALAEKMKAQGR